MKLEYRSLFQNFCHRNIFKYNVVHTLANAVFRVGSRGLDLSRNLRKVEKCIISGNSYYFDGEKRIKTSAKKPVTWVGLGKDFLFISFYYAAINVTNKKG